MSRRNSEEGYGRHAERKMGRRGEPWSYGSGRGEYGLTRSDYGSGEDRFAGGRDQPTSDRDIVEGRTGGHRGKGPRGYMRSDERIRDDVSDRLMDNDRLDASDIEVRVEESEVTLSGTVESRFAKRLAEDLADSVSGVRDVHNYLKVQGSRHEGPEHNHSDSGIS